MCEYNNVPKIRFKGFTDVWEQRKLGDLMDITSVKRIHQSDWTESGIRFLRARDIVADYKKEEIEDKLYISKEKYDEYSLISGKVQIGDLLVTGVGTIGIPYLIRNNEPIYFKDGNIIWFKNNNKIDDNFLYYSFVGSKIQNFINEKSGVGTVGTYTIQSGKETPIMLTNNNEQRKISNLMSNLDNLITLHQRKCDTLVNVKKSLLEKMFPKNSSNIPEIRFKEFTDVWEQRKFIDFGTVSMCKRIFKDETSENGDIPFYKIGTFGDKADAFISNEKYEFYKSKFSYPNKGDILLSASGTIGRIVEYNGEKAYFQDSNIVWLNHNDKIKNCFLKVLYPTVKWDGIEGSTIKRLYNSNFLNTEIMVPDTKEQDKIGELFTNIDNLITLHQRKLEKLKNIKKSMLEKMFV